MMENAPPLSPTDILLLYDSRPSFQETEMKHEGAEVSALETCAYRKTVALHASETAHGAKGVAEFAWPMDDYVDSSMTQKNTSVSTSQSR